MIVTSIVTFRLSNAVTLIVASNVTAGIGCVFGSFLLPPALIVSFQGLLRNDRVVEAAVGAFHETS